MNYVYISHSSAFFIYRELRKAKKPLVAKNLNTRILPKKSPLTNNQLVSQIHKFCKLSQIDIMLSSKDHCFSTSNVSRHLYANKFPSGSFLQISENLAIVSPKLLFCLMANVLDMTSLFLLGLEICGSFCIAPEDEHGFIGSLQPLTSSAEILKFIDSLNNVYSNFRGIKRSRKIAKLIADGSASPQESRLYITLCAPRYLGGYGITGVCLNKPIHLSHTGASVCGQNMLVPDLSIVKNKIAIEYDSDSFHDNSDQNNKDKRRLDAYAHEG